MANIRCPNCGKDNPDLLDLCQYCQTPLKPDSVLRIGEKPTKKNTGELENVLPDWLKNIQQQAKDAAEEDAVQAAAHPAAPKSEPPDLLAGLASQAGSAEDEDIPDWLSGINPSAQSEPTVPSEPESATDFFTRFNQKESDPESVSETPPQEESTLPWMTGQKDEATIPFEKDELSEWFTRASGRPEEIEPNEPQGDMGWGSGVVPSSSEETSPPREEEDLSWLHNLEASAKQTGDLQSPKSEMNWTADFETPSSPSQPSSQEDLSWLDRLGGIDEPSQPDAEQPAVSHPTSQDDLSWLRRSDDSGGLPASPEQSQPAAPQEDLSWLNNLGASLDSEPQPVDAAPNQPIPPQPVAAEEDLDWLNKLGETPLPDQSVPAFSVPDDAPASQEDLSWLNDLGKAPEPPAPAFAPEDLSWLNKLGAESESPSSSPFVQADSAKDAVSPRQTAPLNKASAEETEPDWLKSAAEAPSMPAPGDLSMDWFSGAAEQEKTPPVPPPSVPSEPDVFSTPGESASLSNQEVDSLFSMEMPDWLSRPEAETAEPVSQQTGAAPITGDELTPVDLPSWVQAMRPVEAVITETASSVADQPAETAGPLAGLHGVIPVSPIGHSRKPKAVSLTLQVTEEQQASALLLEQILGTETSPRALITSSFVASQHWLRWALTAIFLLVLSAIILLRSQMMPVSAGLPGDVSGLSNAVMSIPANARVLVVVDYEPSLAGEMEAVSGPLLDQMMLLSQPNLSFISTSPNGAALVERLMSNREINQTGMAYQNLGYLPGGSAGVLGFIEAPGQIIPSAGVQFFSEYSALVVLTDHAESGRVWVEQLQNRKQVDLTLANQPLLVVASAQAGPLLQPYVSSRQITAMISGLSDAVRYEQTNNNRPGIARSYWDTFGAGLMMSVALIVIGSLWSLFTGLRAGRASAE